MQERASELFRSRFGGPPAAAGALSGDGSARTYVRLEAADGRTAVAGYGPDAEENRAYLSFSRALRGAGLPVPEIYAADEDSGVWLEEDLGDTTLFEALRRAREGEGTDEGHPRPPVGAAGGGPADTGRDLPGPILEAYRRVVEWLPRFQVEGHAAVDYGVAYPHEAFDRRSILWDLNYFKYHFLKLAHVPFHEARLEADFETLAGLLLEAPPDHFLYRDFQSRNVMLRDGEPWFIDYQGGRRGAPHYDVASLLYDAKADLGGDVRIDLLERYLDAREALESFDRTAFRDLLPAFVLVRLLQAMGAYGYRGFYEGKSHFLQSVPYAARNVAGLLEAGLPAQLPELERVLGRIVERFAGGREDEAIRRGLTLHLTSFSYRRGYPGDAGGHGGGFVFDCRALPNPGREEACADLTGLDEAVRTYLRGEPACEAFYGHARALVDAQLARYRERGFTDLSVAFGCTGGQHRSVYLAERLRDEIRERFEDVRVELTHREAPFWPGTR
ncbi:MAG TPA: RNase adapter RapZ [Gemmatimonadota bacterium]|nr:RNase adapter RapZ [Gemmatimonadota bacterium]